MRLPVRVALTTAALGAAVAFALPVVQMAVTALSHAEPSADCAVVLGARVYDDGTPSLALSDRVDEAVRLYQAGRVRWLIMSGGRDDATGVSEALVMRARAASAGVPKDRILVDEQGYNTAATARNAVRLLQENGLRTALLVTHYFHEPRTKLLFSRQGVRGQAAPAHMTRHLALEPWFVVREVIAYYAALVHLE
jgi:uncharacterized SAM-binding protein YcdF (DUF218 family)